MKSRWSVAFTVAIASATLPVVAQSLVDVARQEQARRGSVRRPSKVFTNASLSPAPDQTPGPGQGQPPSSVAALPATPGNSSAATIASAPAAKPAPVVLDEKQWRSQAAALRAQIAAARKELAALAGASHDDPREQAMLEALRKRRQDALTQAEEAQRSFEMRADYSAVPRAWLLEPPK